MLNMALDQAQWTWTKCSTGNMLNIALDQILNRPNAQHGLDQTLNHGLHQTLDQTEQHPCSPPMEAEHQRCCPNLRGQRKNELQKDLRTLKDMLTRVLVLVPGQGALLAERFVALTAQHEGSEGTNEL